MSNASQSALHDPPDDRNGKARTTFGGIEKSSVRTTGGSGPNYQDIAQSSEFRALRRRVATFVFPLTAIFLAWYLAYVIIAAYLPDFMAQTVFGEINVGLLMGFGQFASTVLITVAYVRFAERYMDPATSRLRSNVDAATGGGER